MAEGFANPYSKRSTFGRSSGSMKNFVVVVVAMCLAIQASADETKSESFARIRQKCYGEVDLAPENAAAAQSESSPDFSKVQCYIKCFMEALKLYNPDGTLNIEATVQASPEANREGVRHRLVTCDANTKKVENRCEYSYSLYLCQREANPEGVAKLGIFEAVQQ